MTTEIIVEGNLDKVLLELVLPVVSRRRNYRIVSAGGRSSAVSLARSYLATKSNPVALVVDADTSDGDRAAQTRQLLVDALRDVTTEDRFRVVLAIPEMEVVFFANDKVAEEFFGPSLSPADMVRGKYQPRETLRKLIYGAPGRLIDERKFRQFLQQHDLRLLGHADPIRELVSFLGAAAPEPVP